MTIIGMILRFRQLTQEALHETLIDRIPLLLSSIRDFHEHAQNGESAVSPQFISILVFCLCTKINQKFTFIVERVRNGFCCWNSFES